MRSSGSGGHRSLQQTTPANRKAGHSTSGSSSSDNVPDQGVGSSTRTQTQGSNVESDLYEMHIILQPPVESRPGNTLTPPMIISLRKRSAPYGEVALEADTGGCWAIASVVSEDGLVALAPPSSSLLSGTLADSVHSSRLTEAEGDVGHLAFDNLTINQPGCFRLRISLLQMPGNQDSLATGVRNIASVLSHVIRVGHNAPAPALGKPSTPHEPFRQQDLTESNRSQSS
ncbi:MAG: hypothetical protein Q9169_002323 [Polycauliona sp. 2 TL-2023]